MTSVPMQRSPMSVGALTHRLPLRLRLKPRALPTGHVDGGWWPRSRDLGAELPTLLAVLAVRLGRIERVTYNLNTWGPVQRKIEVDGELVRLGGFRTQHADTLVVYGAKLQATLLVVPPEAPGPAAHRALMEAGHRGNTAGIEELLASARYQKD